MGSYKKYFFRAVQKNFPEQAEKIIDATNRHFAVISPSVSFAKTSGNPIDRRLDFSAYFLALIKTLDEQGENFEIIRKTCLDAVLDYVRPKNKIQQILKKIPARLIDKPFARFFVKLFHNKVSRNSNTDGFIANIITDKKDTYGLGYGIDIIECGICKLFEKYDYRKYASILCEVDAVTSNLAGLQLIRNGTIANGAKKCDFRFKKNNLK
jgi:hypothetical protein